MMMGGWINIQCVSLDSPSIVIYPEIKASYYNDNLTVLVESLAAIGSGFTSQR